MSDHETNNENEGLDRRSMLKKAAVAGTIAWTAPTIIGSTAHADISCTPKCRSGNARITLEAQTFCQRGGSKWAYVTIAYQDETCPCTPGTLARRCIQLPTLWAKNNTACNTDGPADGKTLLPGDPQYPILVPPLDPTREFVVKKNGVDNGALGDGYWAAKDKMIVALGCADRTGDIYWNICEYEVCFLYEPGTGNCAQDAGAKTVQNFTPTRCWSVCSPASSNFACPSLTPPPI